MRPGRQKVIGPHVVTIRRAAADARPVGSPQPPSFGLFLRHFQPCPPPQPFDPLVMHPPALTPQQPRDPPIAIAAILGRQFHDAVNLPWFIIRHPRPMPRRRLRLPPHPTRPPLGDAQPLVDPVHRLPAFRRAQKFPEATSWSVALSNAWSATSFLSRVAWSSHKPPSSFRHR